MTRRQPTPDRQRLCEELLAAAGVHGEANGDYEYQLGDVENFFRVAFSMLTDGQCNTFWNDPRVSSIVREIPEYRPLAMQIYGESSCDEAE